MPRSELSEVFCYVYVLRSQFNGSFYVGSTHDLVRRMAEHNKSLNRSTKANTPWELIYYEAHRHEQDAQRREKYLKTTAGQRALKRMIREELAKPSDLNNRKSTTGYA